MIRDHCFTLEWIIAQKGELGSDLYIIEKAIYALSLLEHLAESSLDFVFKGGTSLLLHLDKVNRLSVDIDIVCNEEKVELEKVLDQIRLKSSFIKPDDREFEDKRGERGLPNRRHFRFYYHSVVSEEIENVILDIVEDECKLPTVQKNISCSIIEIDKASSVRIPTIEALLGDKLTAFSPTTLGVPFQLQNGDDNDLQVMKQLFDVGELFNYVSDITKVKEAYLINFEAENGYKGNSFTVDEVLDDTKKHCLEILKHIISGNKESDASIRMLSGCQKLYNHLLKAKFRYNNEAKITAANAYLLSEYILGNCDFETEVLIYSVDKLKKLDSKLPESIKYLERLKRLNPEAYYYLALTNV